MLSISFTIRSICLMALLSFTEISLSTASGLIKSDDVDLKVELIAEGLGVPWGMAFLTNHTLLVTDRNGKIHRVNTDTSNITVLDNLPDTLVEGQGGLLDVAIPHRYGTDSWIYFTYVKGIDGLGVTVLARAKLEGDAFSGWQELLITQSLSTTSHHFGSRIAFDNGHVYFTVGDRGVRKNSQDLSNHAGTIIRLNLDGSVPTDNPFYNDKTRLPEIWSYGHRNPQGLAYDESTDRLWSIEHGPRGGDEINLIMPGVNYGWPVISYGKEYWGPIAVGEGTHAAGMAQPVKVYTPSIAPGSLLIYTGKAIPQWHGDLFSGALKLQHINRVVLSKQGEAVKEERLLESLGERIRALAQSPEGWLYFTTDSGKLFRLLPQE